MKKFKKILVAVLTVLCMACFTTGIVGCSCSQNESSSIFTDGSTVTYVLSENYKLTDADVSATNGSGKQVLINRAVTFNLNGKTLDLNGHTLKIASQAQDCLVKFEAGNIVNGTLDISVPNGDIEFTSTELASNVTYEFEAASSTIRLSNVKCLGSGTVKSETRVQIDYSEIGEISLSGNGTLNAGDGASFKKISVSANAVGASVNISKTSTVKQVAVSAKSEIKIAGGVEEVVVSKNATSANEIEVKVEPTAKVEKVEINAPAKVEVEGEVSSVTVSETAKTETDNVEVKVSSTATVHQIDVQAKTELEVEGSIGNMVVGDKATGTTVNVTGDEATVSRVVVNAAETKIEGSSASNIDKVVVSKEVENEVEVPEDKKEVVEDIQNLVKPHNYVVSEKVDSTCENVGYAIYECDQDGCDDSYTVVINKKPHDYVSEITTYPSQFAGGTRTYTCKVCGNAYTEYIDALELKSESVSELIGALIGDGSYSIKVSEGAGVTIFEEWTSYESNYGQKIFFKLDLAEAALTVKDGSPKGYMRIKVGTANVIYDGKGDIKELGYTKDDYLTLVDVNLYLNGDSIYVESVNDDHFGYTSIETIADKILTSISKGNLSSEDIFKAIEAYKGLEKAVNAYKPFVDAVDKKINKGIKENAAEIIAFVELVGDAVITSEELDEGYVAYSITTQEIQKVVSLLEEKTAKDVIEAKFGEGALATLVAALKDVPKMTVEEIVNLAITFEKNYKFDIDYTFKVIEGIMEETTGTKIDIKALIESAYEMTILDIIYSMNEGNPNAPTKVQLETQINGMIDGIGSMASTLTLNQLFNFVAFGDVDYKPQIDVDEDDNPIYAEEPFALSVAINDMLTMVDEMLYVDIIVNAEGVAEYIEINGAGMIAVKYDLHNGTHEVSVGTQQGVFTLQFIKIVNKDTSIDEYTLSVLKDGIVMYTGSVATGENMLDAIVKMGEDVIASLVSDVTIDEVTNLLTAQLTVMGYKVDVSVDQLNKVAIGTLYMGEDEFGTLKVTQVENTYKVEVLKAESVLYSGELTLGGENTLKAIVKMADQIFASLIVDREVTDLTHLLAGEVTAMGYKVEFNADKITGSASATIFQGETEMGEVVISTGEQGDITLDVIVAEESVATVVLSEVTGGYQTTINTEIEGEPLEIVLSIVDVDQNTRKIVVDVKPTVDGKEQKVHTEIIASTVAKENVTTSKLDLYVDVSALEGWGNVVLFDGELGYTVTLGEDGKTDIIVIDVDIDRYTVGSLGNTAVEEGGVSATSLNYASMKTQITIDKVNDKVLDKETVLVGDKDLEKVKGINYDNGFGTTIKYVKTDDTECFEITEVREEFMGSLEEGEYIKEIFTAIVPAKDGLPTYGSLNVYNDCGAWVNFTFGTNAKAKVESLYIKGSFKQTEEGFEVINDTDIKEDTREEYHYFYIGGYYDTVNKVSGNESQHELEVSVKMIGKDCYDGLIVTQSCTKCDYQEKRIESDCYYVVVDEQRIYTQCSETDIITYECLGCHDFYCENKGYEHHNFSYYSEDVDAQEIIALGLGGEGVSSAWKTIYRCNHCQLERVRYQWYTMVDGECTFNEYNVFTLEESEEYPAQTATNFERYKEHDRNHNVNYDFVIPANVNTDVSNITGSNKFSVTTGIKETYFCELCSRVYREIYTLSLEDCYATITYYMNEDKEVVSKYVSLRDCHDVAETFVGTYVDGDINYSWVDYTVTKDNTLLDVNGNVEMINGDDISFYGNGYTMRINFYDKSECLRTTYVYKGEKLVSQKETIAHAFEDKFQGYCCTEGGRFYSECEVCGETKEHYFNSHPSCDYYDEYLSDCSAITEDQIDANGYVEYYRCYYCGKAIKATINLNEDWTLQSDVFIYADGLSFYLNDNTIDLNGYNLIIYTFNGANLGFVGGEVVDTAEDKGSLVIFSMANEEIKGEIDLTQLTLAEGVDYFFSDTDNLETIEQSFASQKGEILTGIHELA